MLTADSSRRPGAPSCTGLKSALKGPRLPGEDQDDP